MAYYDDNYGQWDIEGPEDLEFYRAIQQTNIQKKCAGCGRVVKIQPHYAYCNGCAEKIERGQDLG